jgi:hypothetical protein
LVVYLARGESHHRGAARFLLPKIREALLSSPYLDPFRSPKALVNQAREHRAEFNTRCKAFIDKKPYTQFVEPEPDSDFCLIKVRLTEDFPDAIVAVAADAFNNLRSALDQTVCAALNVLRPNISLANVYFPFGKSAVDLEHAIAKGCAKLPPEIAAVIRSFNPHEGGDAVFWSLNALSKAKHRTLFALGPDIDAVEINLLEVFLDDGAEPFHPYWDTTKNELVISRARKGRVPGYDLYTSFFVAFGEVEKVKEFPVLPVLDYLTHVVERVIVGIEAETARLYLAGRP